MSAPAIAYQSACSPRVAAASLRVAAAILFAWLTIACPVRAATPTTPAENADQRALAALIASRVAELALPAKTVVMPADLALQTADDIKRGNFVAADRIANGVIARSHQQSWRFYPLDDYMASIARGNDPSLLQHLNIWLAHEPNSPAAHLIRAMYYAEAGRTARGTETSNKVPEALMKTFKEDMGYSAADFLTSIRLSGGTPWSYAELERVSLHVGDTRLAMTAFLRGIHAYPGYYPLYRLRLLWLAPKWGGSIDEMYSFVSQYADGSRSDSPLKLLYLDLYANLLDAARFRCHGDRGRCFKDALEQSVRPGLVDHLQQALDLYKVSNAVGFSAATWPLLDAITCPECAGSASGFGGTVLQMAANIMGSDNRLMDSPSHNSYMLDDIVAHVWAQMGNTGNADRKYHEALTDVAHTSFPSPALKARALATIYDHMATFADNTGQFVDVIVYHDAANIVAGNNHGATPWMKCYGFYRLKHYAEAVKECTSLIEGHGNFLPTHYWRAKAYEQLGEWDKSIADFAPVADGSNNWFRVGTALDMSYDFGQKRDYAGQLASMDRYAYLFDARIQSRHDLAVAYNNRCFAYMKLGRLLKARSCPRSWCTSRESWLGWTRAQLTTADNRAG
jgi:tetratricopeptide (TPR) repeat protein